jgi:hypothetical protein
MNYIGKLYGKIGRRTIQLAATSEDFDRMEKDLGECVTTLESVRDYLKQGTCLCVVFPDSETICARCRMLADVETTIANCKP